MECRIEKGKERKREKIRAQLLCIVGATATFGLLLDFSILIIYEFYQFIVIIIFTSRTNAYDEVKITLKLPKFNFTKFNFIQLRNSENVINVSDYTLKK